MPCPLGCSILNVVVLCIAIIAYAVMAAMMVNEMNKMTDAFAADPFLNGTTALPASGAIAG